MTIQTKIIIALIPIVMAGIAAWIGYRYYAYETEQNKVRVFQETALNAYNAYAGGKNDEALKLYQEAVALYDKDDRSLHSIAALYRHKGDMANARKYYARAYELNPDDFEAGYAVALVDHMLKDYTKSAGEALSLIHHDGPQIKYYRLLAVNMYKTGKYDDAYGYYAHIKASGQYEGDELLAPLAQAYEKLAKKPAAKEIANEYKVTNDIAQLEKLMARYQKEGYDMKALRTAQKIVSIRSNHDGANRTAAELYVKHNALLEAMKHIENIAKHDGRTLEIKGAGLQRIGAFAPALEAYERSYALKPSDDLLRAMSICAALSGDIQKSAKYMAILEQKNPYMAHQLAYALETKAGIEHTKADKLIYLALEDWYALVCKLKGCEDTAQEAKGA
ncbi:MAG: hypothetical protein JXQ77_06040 [Campylobacterales bacterium]|nr:hypothetical protein [Campylobacterales bacterium]